MADTYRVVLERDDLELWSAEAQLPTPSDTLDLSLPASLLTLGDYRLRAEPQATSIKASTFVFRVVAMPATTD